MANLDKTNPELTMIGSPYNAVSEFIVQGGLPQERAGYILARQALFELNDAFTGNGGSMTERALRQLTDKETADLHQPPLSDELKSMALDHISKHEYTGHMHLSKSSGPLTAIVLNMIIDHGSRGVV